MSIHIRTILILFLIILSPLFGIFLGAFLAYRNEASVIIFSSNIIAAALGIPLALLLGSQWQRPLKYHIAILSLFALTLMSASLLAPGIEGVHRWISIGSMHLNVSMMFAPFILYSISELLDRDQLLSVVLAIGVSVVHVFQPDAGQATAFGCAAITIFLLSKKASLNVRLIGIIAVGMGTIFAWLQPDSLPAVEYVEHILLLAIRMGSLGIAVILVAITSLLAPIFYTLVQQRKTKDENNVLAIAFAVYLLAELGVTELGNYPVPIIGAGAAPVIGWYFVIGLTVVHHRLRKNTENCIVKLS